MQAIRLDVSELPAPEPFEQILQALETISADQFLLVSHRRKPVLIYQTLQQLGFSFHLQPGQVQAFDIFIWHDGQASPDGLILPNLADESEPGGNCR